MEVLIHYGLGEKMESLFKLFRSFVVIRYCQPPGAGVIGRDSTTNLASQCRALKIEKLNAPLFPGPEGVGNTNDWYIINRYILK